MRACSAATCREFGHIIAQMQFNMYHSYTVDEHTLRAVGVIADIADGKFAEEHPISVQVLPLITDREALFLAMLLHDTGKGGEGGQELAGARAARAACERLGLTPERVDLVAWVVEHHLMMSDYAQKRDISDPATIAAFAPYCADARAAADAAGADRSGHPRRGTGSVERLERRVAAGPLWGHRSSIPRRPRRSRHPRRCRRTARPGRHGAQSPLRGRSRTRLSRPGRRRWRDAYFTSFLAGGAAVPLRPDPAGRRRRRVGRPRRHCAVGQHHRSDRGGQGSAGPVRRPCWVPRRHGRQCGGRAGLHIPRRAGVGRLSCAGGARRSVRRRQPPHAVKARRSVGRSRRRRRATVRAHPHHRWRPRRRLLGARHRLRGQ